MPLESCPTTGKICHKTHDAALQCARAVDRETRYKRKRSRVINYSIAPTTVEHCDHCGWYHISRRERDLKSKKFPRTLPPIAFVLAMALVGVRVDAEEGMAFEGAGRSCIAFAVFTEARGESIAGQIAVAAVVKQRIESAAIFSDPCDIVLDANQFHGVRDWPTSVRPWEVDSLSWELALQITDDVMLGKVTSSCPGAHFFWRGSMPPWGDAKTLCSVGEHSFSAIAP